MQLKGAILHQLQHTECSIKDAIADIRRNVIPGHACFAAAGTDNTETLAK